MKGLGKFLVGGVLGAVFGFLVSPRKAQKVRDALLGKSLGTGYQHPVRVAIPSGAVPTPLGPTVEVEVPAQQARTQPETELPGEPEPAELAAPAWRTSIMGREALREVPVVAGDSVMEAAPPLVTETIQACVMAALVQSSREPVVESTEPEAQPKLPLQPKPGLAIVPEPQPELAEEPEPELEQELEPVQEPEPVLQLVAEFEPVAVAEEQAPPEAVAEMPAEAGVEGMPSMETSEAALLEIAPPVLEEEIEEAVEEAGPADVQGAVATVGTEAEAQPEAEAPLESVALPEMEVEAASEPVVEQAATLATEAPMPSAGLDRADLRARIEETRERIRRELEMSFVVQAPEQPPAGGELESETPSEASPSGSSSATESHPAGQAADTGFDQDAMRRRIEQTRNRLKAKAFDAMMSGEASLLSKDSGSSQRPSSMPEVPLDSEVAESIEKTLTEEEL